MRKVTIVLCGLLMLIGGGVGFFLPIIGYFWAREWASFFSTIGFPFFPVFYLPFTGWILVTGGGLLVRRQWAWYSVQTFWVFILCIGVLTLVGFNLLIHVVATVSAGAQWRGVGNGVLGFFLILLPLGGLVFFARVRHMFTGKTVEASPWSRGTSAAEERWSEWG